MSVTTPVLAEDAGAVTASARRASGGDLAMGAVEQAMEILPTAGGGGLTLRALPVPRAVDMPVAGAPGVPAAARHAWRTRGAAASVGQSLTSVTASLIAAVVFASLAFPPLVEAAYAMLRGGPGPAAEMLIVILMAGTITVARLRARSVEPPVHDRQLDIVVALPFLAVSGWLALAWPDRVTPGDPLSDRAVVGFTAYLVGACLLLLGTRMVARIRWSFVMPLLAAPSVASTWPLWWAMLIVPVAAVLYGTARRKGTARGATPAIRYAPTVPAWGVVLAALCAVAIFGVAIALEPASTTHWQLLAGLHR